MTEPDFTDMPFALAQVIDSDIRTCEDGYWVLLWPSFREVGLRTAHRVARTDTFGEAIAVKARAWALVKIARRLTGNVPP